MARRPRRRARKNPDQWQPGSGETWPEFVARAAEESKAKPRPQRRKRKGIGSLKEREERAKSAREISEFLSPKLRGGGVIVTGSLHSQQTRPLAVVQVGPNKVRAFYMSTGTGGETHSGEWNLFGGISEQAGRAHLGWFIKPEKSKRVAKYAPVSKWLTRTVGDNAVEAAAYMKQQGFPLFSFTPRELKERHKLELAVDRASAERNEITDRLRELDYGDERAKRLRQELRGLDSGDMERAIRRYWALKEAQERRLGNNLNRYLGDLKAITSHHEDPREVRKRAKEEHHMTVRPHPRVAFNPTEAECDARVRKALSRKKKRVRAPTWESPEDFPAMPNPYSDMRRLKIQEQIDLIDHMLLVTRRYGPGEIYADEHGPVAAQRRAWVAERADLVEALRKLGPLSYRKNPKSSKKEFVEQAWAKRAHRLPAHDYEPRKGLEGPFQYPSGKVLYWDPREGKYWDPSSDLYLTDEEIWTHIAPRKNPKSRSKSERAKERRLRRLKERAGAQSSTEHITEDPRQKGRFSEHGRRKPMYPEKREERRRSRQKGRGSTRREAPERVSPAKSGKPQKYDSVIIFKRLPGGKKKLLYEGESGDVMEVVTQGGGAGRKHGFLDYRVMFGDFPETFHQEWFMEPDYILEKVDEYYRAGV